MLSPQLLEPEAEIYNASRLVLVLLTIEKSRLSFAKTLSTLKETIGSARAVATTILEND